MPEIKKAEDGLDINDVMIITEEIKQVINKLKEQSAAGPDGIPPRVLKELRDKIAVPMNILFRESMKSGKIPEEWREAEMTPIFKKGKNPIPLTIDQPDGPTD